MLASDELKEIRRTFNDDKEAFITNSFRALSDTNRNRIFRLLITKKSLSAGDIADATNISRPLASQHLKILEHTGLLKKHKDGQHIYYELNRENIYVKTLVLTIKKFS